ncbi:radial spoke head protein 6 homolog A [Periplaneta americana]|uniref:radial spoke head protein 6 homolog A n=1 Tax=Periplaneta americana TaxID=6978 RepID=UPI0037E8A1DA
MSQRSGSSIDSSELEEEFSQVSSSSEDMAKRRSRLGSTSSYDANQVRKSSTMSYTSDIAQKKASGESEGRFGSQQRSTTYTRLDMEEPSSNRIVKHVVSDLLDVVNKKEEEWLEILKTPNLVLDQIRSKAFLQKPSKVEGVSLYDHLSELINKILEEKPENVVDYFEEYSRNLKEERFRPATDRLQDMYVPPGPLESAKKMMNLFEIPPEKEAEVLEEDEPTENIQTDVMETQFYFENGGIGLPRNEMFLIALGMRKLRLNQRFKKIRFWGKILGTEKNYYIVETDLSEEEYERRNQEAERKAEKGDEGEGEEQTEPQLEEPFGSSAVSEEVKDEDVDSGDAKEQQIPLPPIPKSTYKPFPEVPAELSGEGVNKKVYYVCNEPGDEWVMLPDVTPLQINVARQIKKFFTGNLEKKILTFPAFPGKEKNYLRAQIARISAATQVSPLGFYQFSEEEEEVPEEEEVQLNYVENPDYEPVPLKDLIDPSMSFWVHHTLPILKQGRCEWWNPKTKVGEEGEEEVEEEEEDVEEGEQREVGPVLLTPLSEDATLETVPPWSVRQSSQRLPDFAVAVIRSNLWPGAYAYAINRKFDNIYVGWGHKYVTHNYTPPPVEAIQTEYPLGPEIMEIADPTPEDEEAWRLAHEKKKPTPEEVEEEEEEDEGEDEEEEEDEEED